MSTAAPSVAKPSSTKEKEKLSPRDRESKEKDKEKRPGEKDRRPSTDDSAAAISRDSASRRIQETLAIDSNTVVVPKIGAEGAPFCPLSIS